MVEDFHNKKPSTRNSRTYKKAAGKYEEHLFCIFLYIYWKRIWSAGHLIITNGDRYKRDFLKKHIKNIYDKTGVITQTHLW